jgi:hypothetical protein
MLADPACTPRLCREIARPAEPLPIRSAPCRGVVHQARAPPVCLFCLARLAHSCPPWCGAIGQSPWAIRVARS